jgi:type IV secretion system protein VirB10
VALGWVVFSSMSHHRAAQAQTPARVAAPAQSDFTAAITPQAAPAAPVTYTAPPPPAFSPATPQANAVDETVRWRAPAMVVDIADTSTPAAASADTLGPIAAPARAAAAAPVGPVSAAAAKISADESFADKVESSTAQTAHATRLADLQLVAPQGTVIPAIMETALNSDLPGFVRAVVSRDVRGFDGSRVLIPRGSKLIGQYRAGVAVGQSRAFVVWSRVLTPDGVSVDIGSPGADRLGQGGVSGETNTHFFQRFGSAILLSVIGGGIDAVTANNSRASSTAIVIGSPQQASNVAAIALQKQIDIPDTITVPQGAPIRVFVARDLDFSGVLAKTP